LSSAETLLIRFLKYKLSIHLHISLIAGAALSLPAFAAGPANPSLCADVPHNDHPKTLLSNGTLDALVFLPDITSGYYRSSRFDWSGVVGCVSLNGHRFFGEWFQKYDPLINDAITGPVEEFRSGDGALGYNEAKPGGLFVKPGVGVLRRVDDSPYRFGFVYPIVDTGKWTVNARKHSVTFTQKLTSALGAHPQRFGHDARALAQEHRNACDYDRCLRPRFLYLRWTADIARDDNSLSVQARARDPSRRLRCT